MNIASLLAGWKWFAGALVVLGLLFWAYGNKRYEAGKTSVYQQIAEAPVKSDTVKKHGDIPAPASVIKWLKPDAVYETPESTLVQIDRLSNDCDSLKRLLAEKAKPWETEMDSARFYLQILTHPWERMNKVKLQIKAIPFDYPEITNSKTIIKEPPWWQHVLEIGGGAAIGYGVSRIK